MVVRYLTFWNWHIGVYSPKRKMEMNSEELVFGTSELLDVMAVHQKESQVVLSVQSRQRQGACPYCGVNSSKLHSYYRRKIKDLPAFNQKVSLLVKAQKWYCCNEDCNQKVFAYRFAHSLRPYKRFSNRLREKLPSVALLMGGNAGKRICRTLHIATSPSTLLRLIHSQAVPEQTISTALGWMIGPSKKGSTMAR